jgi:hypothetical protein
MIPSNFCRRLEIATGVAPKFLWHQLQWLYEIGGTSPFQKATTNIRNLSVPAYLEKTRVWIPALGTQTSVAAALDQTTAELDKAAKVCRGTRARVATLRSAILNAAFSGRLAGAGTPVDSMPAWAGAEGRKFEDFDPGAPHHVVGTGGSV